MPSEMLPHCPEEGLPRAQRAAAVRRARRELAALGHPFPDIHAFLDQYGRFLVAEAVGASGGVNSAAAGVMGELVIEGLGSVPLTRTDGESAPTGQSRANARDWPLAIPLVYADASLGEVRLEGAANDARLHAVLSDCARELAFMIVRYRVSHWAARRLGRPLALVGMSEAVRGLEVFVEKAAHSDLPVLLQGEFGTETPYLAAAVHCCGARADGPFVQVDCAHPAGGPEDWFRQADGGTLFLSDLHALPPALQNQLPRHLHSRLGQWLDVSGTARVRVIATTTADLRQAAAAGTFSRALLAELDFLATTVPPLRDRAADIDPLVRAALRGHGYDPAGKVTPDLLELCRVHAWPENIFELERVVARLAVMTGRDPIHAADVRRHFPDLAAGPAFAAGRIAPAPVIEDLEEPPPMEGAGVMADAAEESDRWLRHALNKDPRALGTLHPGLRKAVLYLVDNYADPIRLGPLARQARVSQSHLCFLFRSGMRTSSKSLLARIRVEKAKALLAENTDQPITDVALQVGFADLSHFEKCFRREVGRTPREFRRMVAG
ncbi:AraC family transcriptional regulator [Azospirillum sp. B4]|uniref:AraC family transcriptional regulator n=1 Tax=Azospirillum sp. B4 TaxID=95605 RepID=UPI0003478247|nr:AraC family transcriptional regulator [Azospirillum sp. B4]